MKSILLSITLLLSILLISNTSNAQCLGDNIPDNTKTYISGCCGDEIQLYFTGINSNYSPVDPCRCGILEITMKDVISSFPYRWDNSTCTAQVYSSECGIEFPILFISFDEGDYVRLDTWPNFVFENVYTTD